MNSASSIAEVLLDAGAVQINSRQPFTWASGILSPIYCDNRILLGQPKSRKIILQAFMDLLPQFGDFNVLAGVATAGIPYGAILADRLDLPFVYVRSKPKDHGRKNRIEGALPDNARVLVIEDLISTGGSSLSVIEALQENGATVTGLLAVFSYAFPETTLLFETKQIPLRTLTDYHALLEAAIRKQAIREADRQHLESWRLDPRNWKAKEPLES